MMEAIRNARVGDDVFGEDTSINELEAMAAGMFGMEAALFCPLRHHDQPDRYKMPYPARWWSHLRRKLPCLPVWRRGIAFNSGASVKLLLWRPRQSNRRTGSLQPFSPMIRTAPTPGLFLAGKHQQPRRRQLLWFFWDAKIKKSQVQHGLAFHLDGARLWNALRQRMKRLNNTDGQAFDSISVCLSKSLGCPIGSLLLGKKDFIKKAKKDQESIWRWNAAGWLSCCCRYICVVKIISTGLLLIMRMQKKLQQL